MRWVQLHVPFQQLPFLLSKVIKCQHLSQKFSCWISLSYALTLNPLLTMSLLKRSSILSHKCFYLFEECVFPPNAAFITVVGADRLRELPCLSLCWGKKKLLYSHRFCRVIYLRFYRRVMEWYVRKIAKNNLSPEVTFRKIERVKVYSSKALLLLTLNDESFTISLHSVDGIYSSG